MKRLMFAGLLALGLALAAQPARAACRFNFSCGFNVNYESSGSNWTCYLSKCSNPLPPCSWGGCGYAGPAVWDGYYSHGAPYYGVAADATPSTTTPSFTAPQPAPTPKGSGSATGLQQAGYYYYPPAGYGYQAPSYWYGN